MSQTIDPLLRAVGASDEQIAAARTELADWATEFEAEYGREPTFQETLTWISTQHQITDDVGKDV